jgi:hypothetical protein
MKKPWIQNLSLVSQAWSDSWINIGIGITSNYESHKSASHFCALARMHQVVVVIISLSLSSLSLSLSLAVRLPATVCTHSILRYVLHSLLLYPIFLHLMNAAAEKIRLKTCYHKRICN